MSGFEKQTYTQVPNSLFEIMGDMDECELKVVLLICRYTFGYHRDEVAISTRKIAQEIAMSIVSVDKGANQAVSRGLIEKITDGQKTTVWRAIVSDSENESPKEPGDSASESQVSQKVKQETSENESQLGVKENLNKEKESIPEQKFWEMVLDQLKVDVSRAAFENYVRDTWAVRFDGNVLSIGAPNANIRDWLESRITSTVNRLLIGIMDSDVTVQFVVSSNGND